MQSPRSSRLPNERDRSPFPVRFPNAAQFAPIFAGRRAPDASPFPNAPFFAEFESSFIEAARRLTAPTAEVLFDAFGFAPFDDFSRRFAPSNAAPSETLLLGDDGGVRYLFVAPSTTLRLLFNAALGFDVEALCADEALWNEFNADAQTPLTSFEEEAFAQEAASFAALSPVAFLASSPTVVLFRPASNRVALELDDALFYWERRVFRLGGRSFPWTLVFPTRFLAPLAEAALPRHFSERPPQAPRPDSAPPESPYFQASPPVAAVSPSSSSFEFAVVVERGEMSAESWRRLKPGDVLTTNVPANALFLGLVDDAPRYLCRPGLFRGAAAVQIKTRADDQE
jgi:hypothetical protein